MSKEFKASYKQAYDKISPSPECLLKLTTLSENNTFSKKSILRQVAPIAMSCCLLLVLSMTALPVMAGNIPAVYNILATYAPSLLDYVLPTKITDTSENITMQVEAIDINDKTAEILISFSDTEGSTGDLIKGKVDLYDSYRLESLDTESVIGGCHFLEYDAESDKAYFKIDVTTNGSFDKSKLRFRVHQLLVNNSKIPKETDLSNVVHNPPTKAVPLSGGGGLENLSDYGISYLPGNADDPRPGIAIMDLQAADASMTDTLTVTGIGYADGFLRIQTCRGNFSDADRHARFYYLDETGVEKYCDFSFGWQEEVAGQTLLFDEAWFYIEENKLPDLQMFGIFYVSDGSVKGDWEVLFSIE